MCLHVCAHVGVGGEREQSSAGQLGLDSWIQKTFARPRVTHTPLLDVLGRSHGVAPVSMAINGVVAWTRVPCSSPPVESFSPGLHC